MFCQSRCRVIEAQDRVSSTADIVDTTQHIFDVLRMLRFIIILFPTALLHVPSTAVFSLLIF